MADVVDIIHRLTYESDLNVFETIDKAFGKQFSQIRDLQTEQEKLSKLIEITGKNETAQRKALDAAYDSNKRKIDAITESIGKEFAASENLAKEFIRQTGILEKLSIEYSELRVKKEQALSVEEVIALNRELVKVSAQINKITNAGLTPEAIDYSGVAEGRIGAIQARINQLNEIKPFLTTDEEIADVNRELKKMQIELQRVNSIGSVTAQSIGTGLVRVNTTVNAVAASTQKAARSTGNLGFAFSQILREAPAFAYSIQTGILALSNNIPILVDQLQAARKAGDSTSTIFRALGQSIFGIGGLITIAVSALTIFGGALFDSGKEAEDAKDKVVDLTKALDDYIRAVKDANNINRLRGTFQFGPSEAELNRELELLKARGASADLIAEKEKEISRANQTQLELIKQQLQQARNRINARAEGQDVSGLARLPEPIQQLVDARDLGVINRQLAEVENEILNEENKRNAIRLTRLRENAEERKKIREKELEDNEKYIKNLKEQFDTENRLRQEVAPDFGGDDPLQRIGGADLDVVGRREDRRKKAAERDKQIIDESLSYAYNTTIQTLQSIYDAQLFYLDKEIALRRERVDQAVLLAEKGNTDILAAEQDRLRKTEEERERVAERQLQLNALLQASSAAIAATQAIQVVTNAGATGDPYSTAARIAAAVAALAAGFAFVTSLTQAFKFKDGVIGLNGPGTETSDSIPARLSKGESVMTAAETKEFRPYLEAMREGTFYNMIANTAQPVFVQGNNYGKLEKKLDGVIAAVEGIHISANQKMDKNGISQAIESYKRQEGNRWR